MDARFQTKGGGVLAFAKVEMLFVVDDDFAGLDKVGIDENVEVTRAFLNFTGRFNQ